MSLDQRSPAPARTAASTGDTAFAANKRRNEGAPARDVQIAIVGGGLAGSLAAVLLGRAGYRVAVIDLHPVYPPDFRCEKLDEEQLQLLDGVGMPDCLSGFTTPIQEMFVARFGRLIERKRTSEHGFFYQDFVNAVRAQIPPNVEFVLGRVADVSAGPDRQRVVVADGSVIEARLVIVATGLGETVRHMTGIQRRMVRENHSLTFGFSLLPATGDKFEFPALTYYGERVSERIAYISVFPVGDAMRANVFTYRRHDDAWSRALIRAPHEPLYAVLPGLRRFLGDFHVVDKVRMRPADLYVVDNHRRDGVVLVGDAFQTTCPAAGTGVDRVLTDVGQLCHVHVPRWFASPGMGANKIGQFYDDPVKQACDAQSTYDAEYCRSFSLETRLRWQAARWRAYLRPRVSAWLGQEPQELPALLRS